jgi:hypothetical protein
LAKHRSTWWCTFVYEGKQYHMGEIEILGAKDIAEQLTARWKLNEGAVYDQAYLGKFLDETHDLLPDGFTQSGNVEVAYDCPEATVSVRIVLQKDRASLVPLRGKDCQGSPKAPID